MLLRQVLIIIPLALIALLLQSFFWVPTYEDQTASTPQRLRTYISASIGDAKILNPILHADTASGEIVDLIFDGLLDLDENLELRGRLATDWRITEEAYLVVNPSKRFPDGSVVTGQRLLDKIERALANGTL